MFNFLSSCGLCSNIPKPGDFAYEVFNKVPTPERGIIGTNGFIPNIESNSGRGPGWQGQVKPEQFLNNMPSTSVLAGDYTFKDLINNNSKNICVRQMMKSSYAELVKEHEQSGQKFTDPDFPPDQRSIGEVEDLRMRATWKRIPDVIRDPIFVEGKIEPNDVYQGSLGDCYFLSAVSALSERDFRIKNLFPELRLNRQGVYMARLLFRGVLREVVVDDYIPVNQQGDPLFAKPACGREIWVMILQKCWAKLHGSYGAIVGGLPGQVLHAISAAPTDCYEISSNKQQQQGVWGKMWQGYSSGGVLCCGTKGEDEVEKWGLVKGHAYTILNLFQTPFRILKLRNPWGNREWKGRANDGDRQFWAAISAADRQNMGVAQRNDGTFFMLWEDWVNFFDIVDICRLSDNANYSFCETEINRKRAEMFEFQSPGGSLTLSFSQRSLRGMGQNIQKKGYARSVMIVGKQEEASGGFQYRYVSSSSSNSSAEHSLDLRNLSAGKYVIYVKANWLNGQKETACLSVYGDVPVHLSPTRQWNHKQFVFKVFLDHARNNQKKQMIGAKDWVCSDLLLSQCGYGYLAFHIDEQSSRKLGVQIAESDYTERRFILKKPYRGSGLIKASVEAGKELIIVFRIKSQNFPNSVSLPSPKIYNLI